MHSSSRQYPLEELLGPDPCILVCPVGRPHWTVDLGWSGRQPPLDLLLNLVIVFPKEKNSVLKY